MRARRIIVVVPDPPLPFGNAAGRWFYVLARGLQQRGHRVTIFAASRASEESRAAAEAFPAGQYDLRLYPRPRRSRWHQKWLTLRRPHSYVFSPELCRDLERELAKGFDVLHLEDLWTGWLGLRYASRALLSILYSFEIDLAEAPSASPREWLLRRWRTPQTHRLLRSYQHISTLTPRLAAWVHGIAPSAAVDTIPLGLDLTKYPFSPRTLNAAAPVVSLIGSFTWHPTIAAGRRLLTRLWPELKRHVPNARLEIVGRRAADALGNLAATPGVTVHQDVPEILPYFSRADLLLYAPGDASGMKVKVLESFALGVPVVTTPSGVEGLPAQDGVHAGLADDDEGLVTRAAKLLTDPGRWAAMRASARELVARHCEPKRVLDALERVYDSLG